MTQYANAEQGAWAEQWAADYYDIAHEPDAADWYDAIDPNTGTKYEVKSTHVEIGDGGTGRFRLWEDQHRSITASNASGTAWYVFVVLDASGDVVEHRRTRPSTVTKIVRQSGGWNEAHHEERDGRQYKLPWDEVIR